MWTGADWCRLDHDESQYCFIIFGVISSILPPTPSPQFPPHHKNVINKNAGVSSVSDTGSRSTILQMWSLNPNPPPHKPHNGCWQQWMYFTLLCIAASVSFFTLTIINLSTIHYAQEGGSKYATTATQQPQYQSREKVGIEVAYSLILSSRCHQLKFLK